MNDLSTWLRAQFDARERQLDDDERVALAAIADDTGQDGGFEDAHWLNDSSVPGMKFGDAAAEMIRRVAVPRKMLAEVRAERRDIEAKKLILAWCDRLDPGDGLGGLIAPDAREIRKLLAVRFADEEGFRAEWLPSQRPEQDLPQQGPSHVPTNELLEHPPEP